MTQTSAESMRALNFFQAVGATLKTVPGSMGTISSVGTFLYAWVNAPITSYIQLAAGIISLSNETKVRLQEKNIAYKSIIDHVSDGANRLKHRLGYDRINPIESLPASWQTTWNQGINSSALNVFVEAGGYVGHVVEPAARIIISVAKSCLLKNSLELDLKDSEIQKNLYRCAVSLLYLMGMGGAYHQTDLNFNPETNRSPGGAFKNIKRAYRTCVPEVAKPFLENPSLWFSSGNALLMITAGTLAASNPVALAAAWTAMAIHTTVIGSSIASGITKNISPNSSKPINPVWINKPGNQAFVGGFANMATAVVCFLSNQPVIAVSQLCWGRANHILGNYQRRNAER